MSLFKRQPAGRLREAEKAKEKHLDSSELQNLKNRLGLSQREPESRVIRELQRLRNKSQRTWKALKLTEADFEKFGIKTRT